MIFIYIIAESVVFGPYFRIARIPVDRVNRMPVLFGVGSQPQREIKRHRIAEYKERLRQRVHSLFFRSRHFVRFGESSETVGKSISSLLAHEGLGKSRLLKLIASDAYITFEKGGGHNHGKRHCEQKPKRKIFEFHLF